jgi:hypothetical protein
MTNEPRPSAPFPTPPQPPVAHRGHDPFLVASLLDPDLGGEVRSQAEAQVAVCPACAALLDDLQAIAAATAVLPVPPRRRDFRLRPEDAARLRPRGLRRLVAAFGAPRLAVLRPLGAAVATLGLAGLLLTATPLGPGLLGGGGSAAERTGAPAIGGYESGVPNQITGPAGPEAETAPPKVQAEGGTDDRSVWTYRAPMSEAEGQLPIIFAVLLAVGLGLVALRVAAERMASRRRAPPG